MKRYRVAAPTVSKGGKVRKLRLVMVILHLREGMFKTFSMKVAIEDDLDNKDVQRRILDVVLKVAKYGPLMVTDYMVVPIDEIVMVEVLQSQGYTVAVPPENQKPVDLSGIIGV